MPSADWEHRQLLVVTLEFSENSGCHGQPKAERRAKRRQRKHIWSAVAVLCLAGVMIFLKGMWGQGTKALTHFQQGPAPCGQCLKWEIFMCLRISCTGQEQEWSLYDFPALVLPWLGNVCGLLGRAVSKSRDDRMSSPSWMEMHAGKGMLRDKSVIMCGYVSCYPSVAGSSFRRSWK